MFFLLDLLRCPVSISPFDKPYIFFETEITWNIYWLVFIGSLKFLIVTIKPYAYMIINREIFSSSFHEYILLICASVICYQPFACALRVSFEN